MIKVYYSNELYHHGILGQKWGIRRYQNKDGSLTAEGREHYNVGSVKGNIVRALTYNPYGQKIGVNLNRGYRKDVKEIKAEYKKNKEKIENNSSNSDEKKKKLLNNLKNDYRKTKLEARISAAESLYSGQSKSLNEKIQSEAFLKQYVKELLIGGYGSLKYDEARTEGYTRGQSYAIGALNDIGNYFVGGMLAPLDYYINGVK